MANTKGRRKARQRKNCSFCIFQTFVLQLSVIKDKKVKIPNYSHMRTRKEKRGLSVYGIITKRSSILGKFIRGI